MKRIQVIVLVVLAAIATVVAPILLGLVLGFVMSGKKHEPTKLEVVYVRTARSSSQTASEPPAP